MTRHGLLTALARRWFFVVLLGGLGAVLVWPQLLAWTQVLEPRLVVTTALFLMAWTLPTKQLGGALYQPGPALWACVISLLGIPFACWLVGGFVPLIDFRMGLQVSAAVPCTLATAVVYTRMSRGDDATALLVVFLTTGSSWLVAPLLLRATTGADVEIDLAAMMFDLAVCLLLPVTIGQGSRTVTAVAAVADRLKQPIGFAAQLLILAIVLKGALMARERLQSTASDFSYLGVAAVAAAAVGVHVLAFLTGIGSSYLLRFAWPQRIAVGFAGSQKTLPVAMLLLERYFTSYPLAVVPVTCYHVGQLLVDTLIADHLAAKREPRHEPR